MSTQHPKRQYPTLTLGTVYLIDNFNIIDELTHLCTHIDGDLRNYKQRASEHGTALRLELTDAYPSQTLTLNNEPYIPPINNWDTARLTITPTTADTLTHPSTSPTPELQLSFLIDHTDFQHTLGRATVLDTQKHQPQNNF